MKYTNESTYHYKGKDIVFKYVEQPTLEQRMNIVDDIANGVMSEMVEYEPILYNYFVAVAFVTNLTNIELPLSFTESAQFIESTNLLTIIKSIIPIDIVNEILDATDKKIEFKKNKMIHASKLDELFAALTMVVNKYADTFEGLDINDIAQKLTAISEFAKMPQEDIVSNILKFEQKNKLE